MKWQPRVVYPSGGGTTVDFTLPQAGWIFDSPGVGGGDETGTGVPVSYEIRRDRIAHLTLRFRESEWPAVEAWVEWAQGPDRSFDFRFDQDDVATEHTCYLHSPRMGESVRPRRAERHGTYEIDVAIRTTDGSKFDVRYYG